MGHMNVVENLRPLDERIGCGDNYFGHTVYDPDCFGCFVRNGGGND